MLVAAARPNPPLGDLRERVCLGPSAGATRGTEERACPPFPGKGCMWLNEAQDLVGSGATAGAPRWGTRRQKDGPTSTAGFAAQGEPERWPTAASKAPVVTCTVFRNTHGNECSSRGKSQGPPSWVSSCGHRSI